MTEAVRHGVAYVGMVSIDPAMECGENEWVASVARWRCSCGVENVGPLGPEMVCRASLPANGS